MQSILKRNWPADYMLLLVLIASATAVSVPGQDETGPFVTGRVVDQAGFAVVAAVIELRSSESSTACRPDNRGIFKCYIEADGNTQLTIRADGFSILRQFITNIQETNDIGEIILSPAAVRESVIVSSIRAETSVAETPASVFSIDREDILTTAGSSIDDVLKRGVGFSLFRRSGSRTSNPTTQGASIRGVNASGASRAVVLFDGIPVNDPFGGWVVWSRMPKTGVERIEVLRGGSSAYYGSGSVGGTIVVVPKTAEKKYDFSAEISAGTGRTYEGSFFGGIKKTGWSTDFSAAGFQTRGYRIVDKAVRGAVDDFANSRNTNFRLRAAREIGKHVRAFGNLSFFGESRNNGTPVQKNRSHIRSYGLRAEFDLTSLLSRRGDVRATLAAFGQTQVFDQTFSAVFVDRTGETLVRLQRVPAQQTGLTAYLFSLYRGNSLVFGFEEIETRGASDETGYFGGIPSSGSGSGGRESRKSFSFQDFVKLNPRFGLSVAARYDRWKNYRGINVLRSFATDLTALTRFPGGTETAFSPTAAILAGIDDQWSAYFSAGRSFRSPTLNELYRGFRVGNIVTEPNAFLRAERAQSVEGGIRYSGAFFFFQANVFRTKVSEAIANVTVDPGPVLILRQRQNAGETSSTGFEVEAEFRKGSFTLSTGYMFLNAKVDRFSSNAQLEGLRIPQVPAHQFTFQAYYRPNSSWTLALSGRAGSAQFDDDVNMLRLERYFNTDFYGALEIVENTEVFATIENLFGSRHSVSLSPVRTISPPFAFRAGIRWN